MNKSESIAKLAEALSKAQGAMKNAIKDSAGLKDTADMETLDKFMERFTR